ncbi:hypothetical protein Pcinc_033667 [Petrolisthes cinctipes]|uniref:Uncharacterized protein n=1 Tax=Petrolisthes cinctipes TaxID=88211 RepID=A0AAE1ERT7_PETCI|nr:hypothetical protein Pcinc_033667 [Petrolisthes cinctipes]
MVGVGLLSFLLLCVGCSAFHVAHPTHNNQPYITPLHNARHSSRLDHLGTHSRHERSESAAARALENGEGDKTGQDWEEVEDNHKKWEDTHSDEDEIWEEGKDLDLIGNTIMLEETVKGDSPAENTDTGQGKREDLPSEYELLKEGRTMSNKSKHTHVGYQEYTHSAHILYSLSVLVGNERYIGEQKDPLSGKWGREGSQLHVLYALKQLVGEESEQDWEASQDVSNMIRPEKMTIEAEESGEKQSQEARQDGGNMQVLKNGLNGFFHVSGWQGYVALSLCMLVVALLVLVMAIAGVKLHRFCRARRRHAIIEKLTKSPSSSTHGSTRN